jgi:hypothetical protein
MLWRLHKELTRTHVTVTLKYKLEVLHNWGIIIKKLTGDYEHVTQKSIGCSKVTWLTI